METSARAYQGRWATPSLNVSVALSSRPASAPRPPRARRAWAARKWPLRYSGHISRAHSASSNASRRIDWRSSSTAPPSSFMPSASFRPTAARLA
eukprot:scaffold59241_cov57-Phaeocystis_antarctica.AAC.6